MNHDDVPMTLDTDDMMWAACSYLFWPFMWLILLFSERKDVPFVRFHTAQATLTGLVCTGGFSLGTMLLTLFYKQFIPESLSGGVFMMALFAGWLVALLLIALWFLYLAYQAAQGASPRVPLIASAAMSLLD